MNCRGFQVQSVLTGSTNEILGSNVRYPPIDRPVPPLGFPSPLGQESRRHSPIPWQLGNGFSRQLQRSNWKKQQLCTSAGQLFSVPVSGGFLVATVINIPPEVEGLIQQSKISHNLTTMLGPCLKNVVGQENLFVPVSWETPGGQGHCLKETKRVEWSWTCKVSSSGADKTLSIDSDYGYMNRCHHPKIANFAWTECMCSSNKDAIQHGTELHEATKHGLSRGILALISLKLRQQNRCCSHCQF